MTRYHLNPATGNPGVCKAKTRCRFGDLELDHHASPEAARQSYESLQSQLAPYSWASLLSSPSEALRGSPDHARLTQELYEEGQDLQARMDRNEQLSLSSYTYTNHEDINAYLRGLRGLPMNASGLLMDMTGLKSAMTRLPSRPRVVYRIIAVKEGEMPFAGSSTGDTVTDLGYVSTTASVDSAYFIAQRARAKGRDPFVLEIATDQGMPLQAQASTRSSTLQSFEDEVLLPANSSFVVASSWTRRSVALGSDRPDMEEWSRHFGPVGAKTFAGGASLTLPSLQLVRSH